MGERTIWDIDVPSRPWPELIEKYRDLVQDHDWPHGPMLRLVERIAESEYADGLFATTSHADLWVAQTPVFVAFQEMLCIQYDGARFRFEYFEAPFVRKRWIKECGPGGGWSAFQHFLRMKRWFIEYRPV